MIRVKIQAPYEASTRYISGAELIGRLCEYRSEHGQGAIETLESHVGTLCEVLGAILTAEQAALLAKHMPFLGLVSIEEADNSDWRRRNADET